MITDGFKQGTVYIHEGVALSLVQVIRIRPTHYGISREEVSNMSDLMILDWYYSGET